MANTARNSSAGALSVARRSTLYPAPAHRRAAVDLFIAFAVAFALLALNVAVNMGDQLHRFFGPHARFPATDVVINILFFWLAALLWLAFQRWRQADRHGKELETVVSSISPDALIVVNPDRKILLCNSSVERVFGHKMSEVVGRKTDLLYGDRRRNPAHGREIYEALEKEGFHVGLATGRRKDGGSVPLEIISADLKGRGGAVLLLRDIGDRVRAEEERRQIEQRMYQRQKLESLGLLAGGIAHDFNNLLMAIMGHADLLRASLSASHPALAPAQEIRGAAARAAELCRELLAYTGKGVFEVRRLDLSDVVREMGQFLDVAIPKSIERAYELAAGLPAVAADAAQIRQIAVNLITNAAEAIGPSAGRITVRTGTRECDPAFFDECVFAESCEPGLYAWIEVADTGCGMDAKTAARIFDPFYSTKREGRGLGLASVHGIIRGHRGALRLTTAPGKGTAFLVLLPVAAAGDGRAQAPEAEAAGTWRGRGTALVVDDEEYVLRLLGRMMTEIGMQPVLAAGGEEALRALESAGAGFACALLDVQMPRVSGLDVYRAIRARSADMPVIFSSGAGDAQASQVPEDPKVRFIQKPYEVGTLRRTLRGLLESGADART